MEHRLICGTSLRVGVSDLLMVDWGTLLWPKTRGDRCGARVETCLSTGGYHLDLLRGVGQGPPCKITVLPFAV